MKNGIFPPSVIVLNSYLYYSNFFFLCGVLRLKKPLFANATLFNLIRLKYTFNKFASKIKNYKDVAEEYFNEN